jgi:hypothetical protein
VVLRAAVGYTSVGIAIPPIRFGHIDPVIERLGRRTEACRVCRDLSRFDWKTAKKTLSLTEVKSRLEAEKRRISRHSAVAGKWPLT